jgi:hypothetical protein
MWKQLWRKWTLDRPAALGDWLWDVLVVQLAALLDRLTLRKIIAFVPVIILILAYAHRIPLPPELMLVGDVLAYIDVFSVILLLSMLSRAAAILFVVKQAASRIARLADGALALMRRLDFRHRREFGSGNRRRFMGRLSGEDDERAVVRGLAWA